MFNLEKLNFVNLNNSKVISFLNNSFLIFFTFLVIFGRSFTGVYFFKFRLAEYLVGVGFILFIYTTVFNKNKILHQYGMPFYLIQVTLLLFFLSRVAITGNLYNFFEIEIFRYSSYIWSVGFIYLLYFLPDPNILNKKYFSLLSILIIPITYLLTSVYYPNSIVKIFNIYSDKFQYLKGSDLFMVFAIFCIFNIQKINNNYLYILFFTLTGIYLPLIFFMSRGASIAGLFLFTSLLVVNRKIVFKKKGLFFLSFIIFLIASILSSVYLDTADIDLDKLNPETAIESLESTLVSRRYQETDRPILYFEYGRINSGDGNLNWRLQIWQDVFKDSKDNNQIIFGQGFLGRIPAMNKIDRMGIDGLNINVHNYLINIFARGGLFQLCLFILFYFYLFQKIICKKQDTKIILFIFASMFVSFFDSSMETARFPIIFYILVSNKYN